jgi:hypothetical protein
MGVESLTDEEIRRLLKMPKSVTRSSREFMEKNRSLHADFELEGEDGTRFAMYARQNLPIKEHFSCGLRVRLSSGEEVTLCRYNGPSHVHTNQLESETLEFVCHIHRATQRYIEEGRKPEHFAEETAAYDTLAGAMEQLAADCSISGLTIPNQQHELFGDKDNE